MAQIVCKDLTLGYGSTVVQQDLSFSVNAGDYLCIIGPNGTGKSTLMKALLGLQPPLQGEITFGKDIRQTDIGYLPQQTQLQMDFPATVREVVRSGCLNRCGWRPCYSRTQKQTAERIMEELGVRSLANRCYRTLSGGQQQRVLLGRALCATNKILLLDEPVAALDPGATRAFYRRIAKIHQGGTTIIMISHDVQAALQEADHILSLESPPFYGTASAYQQQNGGIDHAG